MIVYAHIHMHVHARVHAHVYARDKCYYVGAAPACTDAARHISMAHADATGPPCPHCTKPRCTQLNAIVHHWKKGEGRVVLIQQAYMSTHMSVHMSTRMSARTHARTHARACAKACNAAHLHIWRRAAEPGACSRREKPIVDRVFLPFLRGQVEQLNGVLAILGDAVLFKQLRDQACA